MADGGRDQRDLVYCHSCQEEWYMETHGLECPRCHSEAVEIINPGSDTRGTDATGSIPQLSPLLTSFNHNPHGDNALPPHPLHTHRPWGEEAPDPEEGDIDHVQWSGPGGMHFTRISVRSNTGGRTGPPLDQFGAIFTTLLNGPSNVRGGADRQDRRAPNMPFGPYGPGSGAGPGGPRSPLQEGPPRHGLTSTFHTTRLFPRDANNPQPNELPVDDLSGILSSLLQGMQGSAPRGPTGTPNATASPFALFNQLLNPGNARAGDAVYTQEALDRVISQLMEQHSTSSAPGPAAEDAISALPRVKLDESKLDNSGKAECSICMDNLTVGDEVTELPCKHWFHGECVSAWLREHDTCPQCRRGIMPKNGDGRTPRSPGQVPRHMQTPWGGGFFGGGEESRSASGSAGSGTDNTPQEDGNGIRHNPYSISESPAAESSTRPQPESRRTSTQSGQSQQGARTGGGGGITGWMGRRFCGGNQ